jgi:hypothetical protein
MIVIKSLRWRISNYWFSGVFVFKSYCYKWLVTILSKLLYRSGKEKSDFSDGIAKYTNKILYNIISKINFKYNILIKKYKKFKSDEPKKENRTKGTVPMRTVPKLIGTYHSRVPKVVLDYDAPTAEDEEE